MYFAESPKVFQK